MHSASAEQMLLFKGEMVTKSCLDSLVAVPSGALVSTQSLIFACTSIPYKDGDTLVYGNDDKTCMTYEDFAATTTVNTQDDFIQYTSTHGSLDSILSDIFAANSLAVVVFDTDSGEVSVVTDAAACGGGSAPPPPPPPPDGDNDGIADSVDNCPAVPNKNQLDTDSDGIGDACDNCTLRANTNQLDVDSDGYGNACDGDLNNDDFVNSLDLGLFKQAFLSNGVSTSDFNGDSIVNSLDLGLFKLMFFKAPGPSANAQ